MKAMTPHVYLSPHLDDVVYSCGGLIARQAAQGEPVLVITLCAGDPPGTLSDFARELHLRWGLPRAATAARRAEDRAACAALGAEVLHGTLPDAVYRLDTDGLPRYPDEESIFGTIDPQEAGMIAGLAVWLDTQLPPDAAFYAPLGLGGHVDHVITRRLAERLRSPIYYPDYPYADAGAELPPGLTQPQGRQLLITLTSLEIQAWVAAAALYPSQRSTFWATRAMMEAAFREYHDEAGGLRLIDARS